MRFLRILLFVPLCFMGGAQAATPPKAQPSDMAPAWAGLKNSMRTDARGLAMKHHPDGRISVDLQGRFLHMSALVRGPDGKLRKACFSRYEAMDHALRNGLPEPDKDSEKQAEDAVE